MSEQFKPNTTVAGIIHHKNKFLIVEEIDDGKVVYNQPAGHIEAGEDLIAAYQREVLEETGLHVEPQYLSGIYYYHKPELNLYYLRFCFVTELQEFSSTNPQDSDIIDAIWLTLDELKAKGNQIRSPLVLDCIDDFLKGNRLPISCLHSNLTA